MQESGPCVCQEIAEVLAAVKVVDVGQALPHHKHQGQHRRDGLWLREKEALDKAHCSVPAASQTCRHGCMHKKAAQLSRRCQRV